MPTSHAPHDGRRGARAHRAGTPARALAWLLAAVTAWQPALAQTASQIAQEPLFVRTVVQPNVVLMIDDSQSMSTYQLPPPAWLPQFRQSGTGGWNQGTMQIADGTPVPRDTELILRGAAYNPLWYNPAIRYRPWNDNDRGTFGNARYGGAGKVADGALTERDMRFLPGTRTPVTRDAGYGTIGASDWSVGISGHTYYYKGIAGESGRGRDLFTRRPPTPNQTCTAGQCQGGTVRDPIYGPPYCATIPADPTADPPKPAHEDCTRRDVIGYQPPRYDSCATRAPQQCMPNGTFTTYKVAARYYRPVLNGSAQYPSQSVQLVEIDRARSRDYAVEANRYRVIDAVGGRQASRDDCRGPGQDGSWCTFEQEAQNFANWYVYYRSRLFAAIAVISQSLAALEASQEQLRLGYGRINLFKDAPDPFDAGDTIGALPDLDGAPNPGAIVRGVRPFLKGSAERQQVFDWLFTLQAVGGTPNREALDSVGRYFSRRDDRGPWSDYPGLGGGRPSAQHAACRRSFAMLATDGGWTNSTYLQPRLEAVAGSNALNAASSTALTADGVAGPRIAGDGPNAGTSYQYDPKANPQFFGTGSPPAGAQEGTLSDVAMFYWNRDLRPDVPNALRPSSADPASWQHLSALVVGYGLNASMNTSVVREQVARQQGVAWPTVDLNPSLSPTPEYDGQRVNDTLRAALDSRGDFFSAPDPEQLRASIVSAFGAVHEQTSSGTAVAAPDAAVRAGDRVYTTSFTTARWSGALRAYDAGALLSSLRAGAAAPAPVWEASLGEWHQRKLWTSTDRDKAVPFQSGSLKQSMREMLGKDEVEQHMNHYWLTGYRGWEAPTGPQRKRLSVLGDIVNSTPLYSKSFDQAYHFGPAAAIAAGGAAKYRADIARAAAERRAVVFAGANDGMFHAFDAATGQELWAYVPRAVYPNLALLARPGYQHRYYVDGPTIQGHAIWAGDTQWRTIMVGSTGAGGPGLFAIDVSNPEAIQAKDVLWDLTGEDDNDLGSVIGSGVIGSVKFKDDSTTESPTGAAGWVAVVPNGYESKNNRAVLLVTELRTGTVFRFDTRAGSATQPNGLGSVTPVYDRHRNIVAAYAGDKLGNLWKFDLSGRTGDWRTAPPLPTRLFTATDSAGAPRPITTSPRVTLHPLGGLQITFGTGKFFEVTDPDSAQVQAIYQLWEQPQALGRPIDPKRVRRMSWVETGDTRQLSGALNWQTDLGWQVELATRGERIIASPSIDGAAITLTSFAPHAIGDPCAGGGQSWLYVIDLVDGSAGGQRIGGVVGGMSQLQELLPGGPVRNALAKADLQEMVGERFAGGDGAGGTSSGRARARQTARRPDCVRAGLQIDGTVAAVTRECAPLLPMRTFREVRP